MPRLIDCRRHVSLPLCTHRLSRRDCFSALEAGTCVLEATRQSKNMCSCRSSPQFSVSARFVPTVARPNSLWNSLSLLWKSVVLYLLLQMFSEFALGQHCHQKVSFGPSACHRHHHVAKDIRARVHTATITRHEQRFRICASEHDASPLCDESSEWPFVSAFVPPPTWSYDEQSTLSSCHERCGFGWGRLNSCERRPRSPRYGENGSVTRLRQKMNRAGTWTHGCLAELANVA